MESKPNILITGVSGLLGGNLARHFSGRLNVVGTYHRNRPSLHGVKLLQSDLAVQGAIDRAALGEFTPDYIIHCAGEANVDSCERSPEHAEKNIFQVTKSVAQIAREYSAYLVSISTDAISDGSKEYLTEKDTPNPINVYGRTKLRAEAYLLSNHSTSMVVRTRFYGINITGKAGFTEHLIKELALGNRVTCFEDNYCTQIYVGNLAQILEESMRKRLFGVFNIVEDKKYSRFDYARMVARVFGLDEGLVVPGHMSAIRLQAPRPRDTSLCNAKIRTHIDSVIMPTEKGLEKMKDDMDRWG